MRRNITPFSFDVCVDLYENHLKNSGLSEATVSMYLRIVNMFKKRLKSPSNLLHPQKSDFVSLMAEILDNNRCWSTINLHLSALRSFYTYLYTAKITKVKPCIPCGKRGLPRKLPTWLTEMEMMRIIETPNTTTFKGIRDKAILSIMYDTGMRASYLLGLKTTDLCLSENFIVFYDTARRVTRHAVIGDKTIAIVNEYMNLRNYFKKTNTNALWVSEKGRPLKAVKSIWDIVNYYGKVAIGKNVCAAIVRHTTAVHLLNSGADIRHVCEVLGHKSIKTTLRYEDVNLSHLKNEYKKFPL